MKYIFKIALLVCITIVCSCTNKNKNEVPQIANLDGLNTQFYLGSHLAREPMPSMEEMKKDMETLKKNGFNLIKLQESWAIDEPLEGQYNFSKYEELIAHAKKLGMFVYLGLTMEQAPAWLYEKHPDCRMVGRDGQVIMHESQTPMPADGKPGPCFDHPRAAAAQQKFIKKLVETLGKYDNILVWNTWQEIGYWPDRLVGQPVCFCNNTLQAFRDWLKQKYGTLEALNKEWKSNYAKWEHIKPNRNFKQRFTLPQDINWTYFIENIKITNTLKQRAEIIRATDTLHRPVFCHLGDWAYGSGRDWNYARANDFLGSSAYPASNWGEFNDWDDINMRNGNPPAKFESLRDEMWRMLALRFDFLRSSNLPGKPVWSAEFQGGPLSTGLHKGRVPSPEDMRRWMLTSIGSGVNTISFWVTRAEIVASEGNGFSLLDSEGDSNPRFNEVARIGKALRKHENIFAKPSMEASKVAIFINEANYQFCTNMVNGQEHLGFSTRGWHRLLWDANIPVDFVEASHLDEANMSQYKAIIMPFPISISDTLILKLADYVKAGGNLISEAGIARFSENAYSNRGEISKVASTLFGVKQTSFTMVREPSGGNRWSPRERTWGEYLEPATFTGKNSLEGLQTLANVYIQTFNTTDSEPCLYYQDKIAGTVRNYGKGKAWLFGTFIGHNGTAYRNNDTAKFIKTLMEKCQITPNHNGEFFIRKRKIKGKEALVITNPRREKISEEISVGNWKSAINLFDEPIAIHQGKVTITLESLDVGVILLE